MITKCNYCHTGTAEFLGHIFKNNTAKIYSRFICGTCGAVFHVEHNAIGKKGFDVEHPEAYKRMLPTEDWLERHLKSKGLM
jgi:hypothetical protein